MNDPNHLCCCTCRDFCVNSFACKHLCTLQLILNTWVKSRNVPPIYYPPIPQEATIISERQIKQQVLAIDSDVPLYELGTNVSTAAGTLEVMVTLELLEECLSELDNDDDDDDDGSVQVGVGEDLDVDVSMPETQTQTQIHKKMSQADVNVNVLSTIVSTHIIIPHDE